MVSENTIYFCDLFIVIFSHESYKFMVAQLYNNFKKKNHFLKKMLSKMDSEQVS